jgi:hypothetical protein
MKKITSLDMSKCVSVDYKLLSLMNSELFTGLVKLSISGCPNLTIEALSKFIRLDIFKKLWIF